LAPDRYTSKRGPGTLLVTKSMPFSIEPNSAVVTEVGSRFSTPEMSPIIAIAGSARWPATSSRIADMRARGSVMPTGTAKRAGANWLPATLALSPSRTLIGMVIRRLSTGAPCAS
jgi:hypothetical protein